MSSLRICMMLKPSTDSPSLTMWPLTTARRRAGSVAHAMAITSSFDSSRRLGLSSAALVRPGRPPSFRSGEETGLRLGDARASGDGAAGASRGRTRLVGGGAWTGEGGLIRGESSSSSESGSDDGGGVVPGLGRTVRTGAGGGVSSGRSGNWARISLSVPSSGGEALVAGHQ